MSFREFFVQNEKEMGIEFEFEFGEGVFLDGGDEWLEEQTNWNDFGEKSERLRIKGGKAGKMEFERESVSLSW